MKQKKNPRFRFSGSIDMEIIRRQVKRHRRSVLGQWTIRIVVAAMIVTGTYLVIENQTYTSVATADSHKKDTEDSNQYIAFSDGVIRYSRDGVVFLNKKNKEKWIQPCQIQNPIVDVNEDVFAIADTSAYLHTTPTELRKIKSSFSCLSDLLGKGKDYDRKT